MRSRQMLLLLFTGCIILLAIPAVEAQQTEEPVYIQNADFPFIGGYYESLPADYHSTTKQYPLLIFLHGVGESGDGSVGQLPRILAHGPPQMINNGTFPSTFTVNGQAFSFIVISPQLSSWPQRLQLDTLNNFIDYLVKTYRVDVSRIYLTGLSMGGGIIYDYVSYRDIYAERIAAIVTIAGASSPSAQKADTMAEFNLPIWAFHNHYDPQVSYATDSLYISYFNSYIPTPNPLARLTTFETSGHGGWDIAYSTSYRENGMNAYEWMLQYTRSNAVLPVQLTDFNAILKNGQVELTWHTASEINNADFTIERSTDGKHFIAIANLPGAGTSAIAHTYHYTDPNIYKSGAATLYYRLRQTDDDGRSTLYGIRTIMLQPGFSINTVGPNPFTTTINIRVTFKQEQPAVIRLYTITGKSVYTTVQNTGVGTHTFVLNELGNLPSGAYILEVRQKDKVLRKKLLKN